MRGPTYKLEDDRKMLMVSIPDISPIQLQLSSAGVDGLIKTLGEMRAHMAPEICKSYAAGQATRCMLNPMWVTEPDALAGDTLLHIRDRRYVWLHYLIPREEARRLATIIQKQVNRPEPQLGQVQ